MASTVMVRRTEVLSRDEAVALAERIFGLTSGPQTDVQIYSEANASVSFARGDAHVMAEDRAVNVRIGIKGGSVWTTRLDDAALRAAIADAEAAVRTVISEESRERPWRLTGPQNYADPPKTFFESVEAAMTGPVRAELFQRALDSTEAAGLVGTGDLKLSASSRLVMNTAGLVAYDNATMGQFSLTARTKDGTGSGWAWTGYEDWDRADPDAAIARAVDLAGRSANPVAVEPGRYTVILEPAAIADLISLSIFDLHIDTANQGGHLFSKEPEGNKIGLRMLDERLGMVFDPWDPEMPQSTISNFNLFPAGKFVMFEHGVLKDLMGSGNHDPTYGPIGMRLFSDGPTQTLEEMIASTRRGIWVNRLSNVRKVDSRTHLKTGTTRDGTFLIENGRITKAIRNFRFNESAFFVLNNLEAVGEPVRATAGAVAPRVKVRDFNFTSLTEAV